MPRDGSANREKIQKAAKEEFLALGYEKASMRNIAKKVGLTQAAIYKHYKNKEEMFASLIQPAIDNLTILASKHEQMAYEMFNTDIDDAFILGNNAIVILKELIYKHFDEFKLILCCSQGTRYEHFVHDLVELETKETLKAINYIAHKNNKDVVITKDELHLLLSAYFTAIFEPIVHDWPIDKAIHGLDTLEKFFVPGWKNVMGL